MGHDTTRKTDDESVVPEKFGGMWFLTDELDAEAVGLTVLESAPGRNDKSTTGQEEVYYVVSGTAEVHLDEQTVSVGRRRRPDSIPTSADRRATLVLAGVPI